MSVLREPPRQTEEDLDLADIVVRLRGLTTASQKRRYRGAPPSLPSREIIVDLVDDLVAALYPRHFGPADLAAKDVDAFVTGTLNSALHALHRQAELELTLAKEWRGDNRIDTPLLAGDVVTEFAAARPRVRALLDRTCGRRSRETPPRGASTRSFSAFLGSRPSSAIGSRISSTRSASR